MDPDVMLSLRQFLARDFGTTFPPEKEATLGTLMDRVVLCPNKGPTADLEVQPSWQYNELVDAYRAALMIRDGTKNSLTEGYRLANSHGGSGAVHSSTSSAHNATIKSHEWRQLHQFIGSVAMVRLLTEYSAYEHTGNNFVQLFGEVLKQGQIKPQQRPFVSLDSALYQDVHRVKHLSPFPDSTRQLLEAIFKLEFKRLGPTKKIPPSVKGFRRLATQILTNHERLQYNQIFNNVCPEPAMENMDNIDMSISCKSVMKFSTILFEKLFPEECYGYSAHKSVIFGGLSKLLNGEKGTKLSPEECLSGIKLSQIKWLGKNYEGKMNKQDTEKRVRLLQQFIDWIFAEFFPKILASFFHITHISSGKEFYFFRHDTWKRISHPYLEKYASENLFVVPAPISASQVTITGVLPSTLRIMPKKNNDFRAISVPRRGYTKEDIIRYNDHLFKEIRPAKRILNHIRIKEKSLFPKLTSVSGIPIQIAKFKKAMTERIGSIPALFFLKFDARSCYDTLPQAKIMEIVSKMVEPDKPYYYSEGMNLELESMRVYMTRKYGQLENIVTKTATTKTTSLLGLCRQYVLRGREIVDICRSQLEDTMTKTNNTSYSRCKGVFQGMHMSSLFCDLVYDSLIQERFGFLENTNSVVLRIADDFLVISSEVDLLVKMRSLANAGFPEHGVTINDLKSAVNFGSQGQGGSFLHSFTFCGYKIDIDSLDVIKEYGPAMYYTPHVRSHRAALNRMVGIFKIRIRQNTLDTDLNKKGKILEQMRLLSTNLAYSYYKTAKSLRISRVGFEQFIKDILKEAENNIRGKERSNPSLRSSLKGEILKTFMLQLKRRPKFKCCVDVLKHEQERVKLH